MSISIQDKYALTVEEAAEYFNIGQNRLRELIRDNPLAEWVLWNKTKVTIKREKFIRFLDGRNTI